MASHSTAGSSTAQTQSQKIQTNVMASHSTAGSSTAQTQSQKIQTNVIKTMILVSAFYAISWLPHNVYYLVGSTKLFPTALTFLDSGYYATEFIAFFYTSANPFIYATKFSPVRQILRKMIPCKKIAVQPTSDSAATATTVNRNRQTRTETHM